MSLLRRSIPELYRWFATETEPTSPAWAQVCRWVSETPWLCARLDRFQGEKRRPNLFLGALKYLGLVAELVDDLTRRFDALVDDRWDQIRQLILSRRIQTNEAGRCAVLAPLLASLPQPVRLIELGASAGLCLIPDRYVYQVGTRITSGSRAGEGPVVSYEETGTAPASPDTLVIADRLGVDTHPLRTLTDDDVRWLRALVWPGESRREQLLVDAIGVVRAQPVPLVAGNLPNALVWLGTEVERMRHAGGSVVIMHSATWMYLDKSAKAQVTDFIAKNQVHWLGFEGRRVIPGVSAPDPGRPHFIASLDGHARAVASPHGSWVQWL